jgi:glycyl-tRNA synthetase
MEINMDCLSSFKEVGGCHYRTDHDLGGHQKVSGQSQEVFFDNKKLLPHVLELSFGVDRILLSLLDTFYTNEKDKVVLKLPPAVSPITVSVFPLVNKDGIDKKAKEVYNILNSHFDAFYDGAGSIGRMYDRSDESGIPFAITVDYDTMKDSTVTLRDRNTTSQSRVKIEDLVNVIRSMKN